MTQTAQRDRLVSQAEKIYLAEHARLMNRADRIIEQWIRTHSAPILTDAAVSEFAVRLLASQLRGVFDDPENMRAIFGRLAGLIDADVENTIRASIPSVPRSLVAPFSMLQEWARLNADLISSIGGLIVEQVAVKVLTGEGQHVESLQHDFRQIAQVSESKAKLWARDQTLKLHGQITRERHEQVGIKRYFWTDSNDERVRHIHGELGRRSDVGETFAYLDPPVMSKDGRRGNPGEDYQCRCTAFPVLD